MVVYDVTDEESFNNIKQWMMEIDGVSDNTVMPCALYALTVLNNMKSYDNYK